ncbi:MAG: ATP-dependent RNA helicase HrpA [Betaproteobacteria bacterium]|nr:ATP-dependent RNA helicase HrpA [Betaproteobacteria bacterium]
MSRIPPESPSDFSDCLTRDVPRLFALARELRQRKGKEKGKGSAEKNLSELRERSRQALAARRARMPEVRVSGSAAMLPVNERRAEIAALIEKHQVLIVCGETGSGKTTQLPQICLSLGRGARGLIGHTQPRRLAARSVASRLAQELQVSVGGAVGVKIRFHDRVSPDSCIKLMTDGILLAETQTDSLLSAYDTIIIDEAHERSLNIDFLLGFLKQLLPKRPDLKVIVTSATIDAERFSRHFGGAPVIEVSGRLYPVELRYRPVRPLEEDDDEHDLFDAIVAAIDDLIRAAPGDVLVFLPGEREIREGAEALRKHHFRGPQPEILPLFSRLSAAEQDRVFRTHGGWRIVLATNVAETSLTVPGIRYVVDTGLARVKRYSYRNKVEQLRVEKISRAAAQQRAGRCGRVAAGVCVRLYDEADFNARPEFTDPEILRSSLAGVILRMKTLKFGDVESFPFIEPPPQKAVGDATALLQELNALDEGNELTATGGELAKLPLDPRIARMIVAARDASCLKEVLVIAAALSVQDPRERPLERQQAADEAHRRFADKQSEFLFWVKLWEWFAEAVKHKESNKKLVEACHRHFLSYLRLREWRDTHTQLHTLAAEMGWRENEAPATYEQIHRALLSGLLGNIGCKSDESGFYLGARAIRFLVHPGSSLAKKTGKWLMAAEITETTRLYARCVAKIEPEWILAAGAHLLKKTVFEPHWEKKAMQAIAYERSLLYGLVIEAKRRVNYGVLNPLAARELFIREALVAGEVDEAYIRRWPFFQHNAKLVRDIEGIEAKQRRQDILVDETLIHAFYDHLLPESIVGGIDFDHWRKTAEKENPKLLFLKREDLMRHEAAGVTSDAFPPRLRLGGADYALSYHFEPGSPKDGVTLVVPLAQLNQVPMLRCEWLVPGLLKEKVQQLVKTLAQKIRARLVPVPAFAQEFAERVLPSDKSLIAALIDYIHETRGLNARGWMLTPDAFRPADLPPHLFMNFKLIDEHGRQLGMSRKLAELRAEWGGAAKEEFSGLHETPSEHSGITSWNFGALPELMEVRLPEGANVIGYPCLKDEGSSVSLSVRDAPEEARAVHERGLLRLFRLQLREQEKYLEKNLPNLTAMSLQFMGLGTQDELKAQLLECVFARACLVEPWPRDADEFRARSEEARPRLSLIAQEFCRLVETILGAWQGVRKKLPLARAHPAALADIEAQGARLIHKRFVIETPFDRLRHFPRYLQAAALRLDKLKNDPARDARLMSEFAPLAVNFERRRAQLAKQGILDPQLEQFRWQLEELRVALYAQELKTPMPVSVKRLQKTWESLR